MTLPTFLIIGSMKAGTTALHDALVRHPDVFMPANKEPDMLCDERAATDEGKAAYAALFERGARFEARGEASTSFTKRHLHAGVPERTMDVVGPDVDLIFVARDQVDRIVSHLNHSRLAGRSVELPHDLGPESPYIRTSCYADQVEPWIQTFGRDRLLVIEFSELISDARSVLDQAFSHLGVDPAKGPSSLTKANAASEPRIESALVQRLVTKAPWYEATLKQWVPHGARRLLRNRMIKQVEFTPWTREDVELGEPVIDILEADRIRFQSLTGVALPPVG